MRCDVSDRDLANYYFPVKSFKIVGFPVIYLFGLGSREWPGLDEKWVIVGNAPGIKSRKKILVKKRKKLIKKTFLQIKVVRLVNCPKF